MQFSWTFPLQKNWWICKKNLQRARSISSILWRILLGIEIDNWNPKKSIATMKCHYHCLVLQQNYSLKAIYRFYCVCTLHWKTRLSIGWSSIIWIQLKKLLIDSKKNFFFVISKKPLVSNWLWNSYFVFFLITIVLCVYLYVYFWFTFSFLVDVKALDNSESTRQLQVARHIQIVCL